MPDAGQASVEPEKIKAFRTWLASHGAFFNPKVGYAELLSGYSIVAADAIEKDSIIVTCPFSLAITPALSKRALLTLLKDESILDTWSERQLICSYIVFHWIVDTQSHTEFMHTPYLDTLPSPDQLRTPLHFTPAERHALKGTNLFGAVIDRQRDWEAEWKKCQEDIAKVNREWAEKFTWDRYLSASTYLSSRAFPSTLLTRTPSLVQTPESHPILLPAIDSLNHARAQPVSWVVNYPDANPGTAPPSEPTISLVHHAAHAPNAEIFNNYGPKPNAELILGYGFAVPDNPDDTIVLKVAGLGQRWEVGRDARGAEGLWGDVVKYMRPLAEKEGKWAVVLDSAGCLENMVQEKFAALPQVPADGSLRPDVALMIEHYIWGQRAVLLGLLKFVKEKEQEAKKLAREAGVRLILEDDDEEEDEE